MENGMGFDACLASGGVGAGASRVLLVDDEPKVLSALRRLLRREAFEVVATGSPEEALRLLREGAYAVVLADQRMPGMEGTRLLERAREVSPDTVRVMLTGHVDMRAAVEAINRGAVYRFVTKPWNDEELRQIVRQGVSQHALRMENRRLQELTERQNVELKGLYRALAQARQQEVDIGARVQQTLLLGQPFRDIRGAQVAALTIPSRQIDGDFYDFFNHRDRCFDVIIGDVMGKGVPAALLGAATKTQFLRVVNRLMSSSDARQLPEPEEIVTAVHAEVIQEFMGLESFVTLCYARFDLGRLRMDFVDCGHPGPIHFQRRTGRCRTLRGDDLPLGFSERAAYRQVSVPIEAGDVLFFYSDGLTEARKGGDGGEPFGEGRLSALVRANGRLGPGELIDRIQRAVAAFAGSGRFEDDLTCIAIRVQGHETSQRESKMRRSPWK
jgi:sigma-B regulation protein RsbU (phosphoserine phosphatase)